MLRTLLASLAMLIGFSATAAEIPTPNPKRTVLIDSVIARGNVLPLGDMLLSWSRSNPNKPVDIVISSPGGDVITSFLFLNQMAAVRARGTTIRCFVPTYAASMAFQILVHCSERYTADRAFLLWHRVRTMVGGFFGTAITAPMAEDLRRDMQALDDVIISENTRAVSEMPASMVQLHLEKETFHVGETLAAQVPGFISSAASLTGVADILASRNVPRSSLDGKSIATVGSGGGDSDEEENSIPDYARELLRPGRIVYIHPLLFPTTTATPSK